MSDLTLTQRDPLARGLVWPQRLQVTLGYSGSTKDLTVDVRGRGDGRSRRPSASRRPLYVLPNGGGLGYGYFVLDDRSRQYLLEHIEDVADPLTRGSAWVTLWDNLLERRVPPDALFDAAVRALARETDEQNAQRVLTYAVADVLALPAAAAARGAHRGIRSGAARGPRSRGHAKPEGGVVQRLPRRRRVDRKGLAWLERVWRREEQVPGLTLAEPDEIAMALELAVREVPGWQKILAAQLERTREPRSQGALRLRDAGAVGRRRRTRACVRAVCRPREPAPRAVGAGIAAVPESPAQSARTR